MSYSLGFCSTWGEPLEWDGVAESLALPGDKHCTDRIDAELPTFLARLRRAA